jgi:photosystem II stability/assembly factor-like uncharacterized protein
MRIEIRKMKNLLFTALFYFVCLFTWSQTQSVVQQIPFESVGPSIMSGRIVDVDVNPENPIEFYVGYASGGVWYSNNNGMSFTPIMDNSPTQNVGDIAVDWKTGTIWVGTGENNASRSSYAGIGILKSTDKGKTWQNVGLKESHHIGKIEINPKNGEEVIVAVTGKLYTKNNERGIYKTSDGGKTWTQTLFINEETGVADISVSPTNFAIQYASAWEKDRKAWNFNGSGAASGIYKSEDAGSTWKLISTAESNFPTGDGVGRIGLAAFNDLVVYAILDNQNKRPKSKTDKTSKSMMFSAPGEVFLQMPNKEINAELKKQGLTEKYRAENLKNWIEKTNISPAEVKKLLKDANAALFETEVIGAEIYKSNNGGKTWEKMNQNYIDDFYYSYGYYFGKISVDLNNSDKIYISGVPILKSDDGGKTFVSINRENVHADHHIVWVNPKKLGHLINGNDGGLNISYDDGANWTKCNPNGVGQFYSVSVDYQKPYNIYGGLQDNGVWVGSTNYKYDVAWHQEGKYPYEFLMGGDGMQTQIDNRNPSIIFTGFQFGNYYRIDRDKKSRKFISPTSKKGEKTLRFNWQTPILLSKHNQDILYMGSQFVHRSFDQGDTWTAISPDLTQGEKEGNVAFGTITALSESPFQFGLLYAGSDEGLLHVSKDGGVNWQTISNALPANIWVSRVVASQHEKERVYVTLNGYRNDDFTSFVYVSEDYGQTWKKITDNLPNSPVNVLVEDNVNPAILYVGTDNGLFISLNRGQNWQAFTNGLPPVAVHDAVLQTEANDLVVGTHGRSIYKVNVKSIQQLTDEIQNKEIEIFKIDKITHSKYWGNSRNAWNKPFEPKQQIDFYVKNQSAVTIQIYNEKELLVYEKQLQGEVGINLWNYNLEIMSTAAEKWQKKDKKIDLKPAKNGKIYLVPGVYQVKISNENASQTTTLEIIQNDKN